MAVHTMVCKDYRNLHNSWKVGIETAFWLKTGGVTESKHESEIYSGNTPRISDPHPPHPVPWKSKVVSSSPMAASQRGEGWKINLSVFFWESMKGRVRI